MAKEAVELILSAEEEAKTKLLKAREDATNNEISLLAQAETERAGILAKAREESMRIIQAAEEAATAEQVPLLEAARNQAEHLRKLDSKALEAAVSFVAEKVIAYGHR